MAAEQMPHLEAVPSRASGSESVHLLDAWADALAQFDDAAALYGALQDELRAAHEAVERARNAVLNARSELERALRAERPDRFDTEPPPTEPSRAPSRSP